MTNFAWGAVTLVSLLVGCGGCGADEAPPTKDSAASPSVPLLSAKADGGAPYVHQGALPLGAAVAAPLAVPGAMHGWLLDVRPGARVRVEITRKGTSAKIDTVLFVFAPNGAGGWNPDPVAFDDDSGWGLQSRLAHTFVERGPNLVIVTALNAVPNGRYTLLATCVDEPCDPLPAPTPEAGCHPEVLSGMQACAVEWRLDDDPDRWPLLTPDELVERCADAELVAPVLDDLCGGANAPSWCAGDLWSQIDLAVPPCEPLLRQWAEDTACVFGAQWWRVGRGWSFELTELTRRPLRPADPLTAAEQARVLEALAVSAHDAPASAAEAISLTDDDEVLQLALWDLTAARPFESYTFHAGDNLFGAVFDPVSGARVATIEDGFVYHCAAAPGPMQRRCAQASDCAEGLTCVGASPQTFDGRCLDLTPLPGEGDPCGAGWRAEGEVLACAEGHGLVCAGDAFGGGLCLPAYTRGVFVDIAEAPVGPSPAGPGPVERTLDVTGMLTVPTDVWIEALITYPPDGPVRITLTNPNGTEATVFEGAVEQGWMALAQPQMGFPGDESANGPWTLRVEPLGALTSPGVLHHWALKLGTRWD